MNSRNLTTLNLEPFFRNAIGMNQVFQNAVNRIEHANTGNYPPYNIIEIDEDHYRVEVAVAGFKKNEIDVTVENGQLKIVGLQTCKVVDVEDEDETYLHQGISARSFDRTFSMSEHVYVTDAEIVDGILSILLEREVPEALKPKKIKVK